MSRDRWLLHLASPVAALTIAALAPTPARADFFDGMRYTFTTGIPHFFQDDIPCAFGGRPTSGTKTSCHGSDQPASQASGKYSPPPPPPGATQPSAPPPAASDTQPVVPPPAGQAPAKQ